MNIEDFRDLCLSMPGAMEKAPFKDPKYQNLIAFTIGDKWFCLLNLDEKCCNLKCAPEKVEELQAGYHGVQPAWHMNKKHWIKLVLDSDVPSAEIATLVRNAYTLILNKLPKRTRL